MGEGIGPGTGGVNENYRETTASVSDVDKAHGIMAKLRNNIRVPQHLIDWARGILNKK